MIENKKLSSKLFLEWLQMTVMCGAVSFGFGYAYVSQGDVLPMVAGMVTIAAMLTLLDTRPVVIRFFNKHVRYHDMFRRMLQVHVICEFAALCLLCVSKGDNAALLIPYWWIGLVALLGTQTLTAVDFLDHLTVASGATFHVSVYLTTLFTGVLHILAVMLLAAMIRVIVRVYKKIRCKP